MSNLEYSLLAQDGRARHGKLITAHGVVETPAFMPVGTAGVVKSPHAAGCSAVRGRDPVVEHLSPLPQAGT